jgi:hypothetical protein
MGKKETRDYDNNLKIEDATIEKHFDFRLTGDIDLGNNYSSSRDYAYGYALYRDEINAQENCNADILIEQEGKDNNPHKTKYTDNNNQYLGNDDSGYGKQWNEKYQLDLIGRDYCRDRVKSMKNKREKTREEKIAERLLYEQQNQAVN